MKKNAKPAEPAAAPAVIVFGLDENDRAHASWFPLADALLAEKAAALMGMQVLRVSTDEHRAVAVELPAGRVFASGKGFVPFAAKGSYDRLAAFDGAFKPEAPVAAAEPLPEHSNIPTTWSEVQLHSRVLARDPEGTGWFESVVIESKGDLCALRWCDWPDLPPFLRRVEHLSLLSAVALGAIAEAAEESSAASSSV